MVQLRHVLSETVTLSGDQNEVFESLVDFQRLLSWDPTVKRFFPSSFSTFDFNNNNNNEICIAPFTKYARR